MLLIFLSLVCGVIIGQEVSTLPKLKPLISDMYAKFFEK